MEDSEWTGRYKDLTSGQQQQPLKRRPDAIPTPTQQPPSLSPLQSKSQPTFSKPLLRQDLEFIFTWMEYQPNYERLFGSSERNGGDEEATTLQMYTTASAATTAVVVANEKASRKHGYGTLAGLVSLQSQGRLLLSGSDLRLRLDRHLARYKKTKELLSKNKLEVTAMDRDQGISTMAQKLESVCMCYGRIDAIFGKEESHGQESYPRGLHNVSRQSNLVVEVPVQNKVQRSASRNQDSHKELPKVDSRVEEEVEVGENDKGDNNDKGSDNGNDKDKENNNYDDGAGETVVDSLDVVEDEVVVGRLDEEEVLAVDRFEEEAVEEVEVVSCEDKQENQDVEGDQQDEREKEVAARDQQQEVDKEDDEEVEGQVEEVEEEIYTCTRSSSGEGASSTIYGNTRVEKEASPRYISRVSSRKEEAVIR
ncbi:hypothetical protein BGZ94_009775 [Podila epigama]|nr:hypothetical protein BGZ94_009775 [Podila epigama]